MGARKWGYFVNNVPLTLQSLSLLHLPSSSTRATSGEFLRPRIMMNSRAKVDFSLCPQPHLCGKTSRSPRPSGSGNMSGDTPRPTPPSAEESRPPTPSAEDQLVAQETALFGPVSEYEETGLPPPPYDPKAAAANGVNGVDAAGKKINGVPPRAKRPKNPKIRSATHSHSA